MDVKGQKTSVLYVLDWNVGNETDDPKDPFSSGRIAVGSTTGGTLKTLVDHEQMPDSIIVSLEKGGYLVWTLMGYPGENDGRVQVSRLDGTGIHDIYAAGEIHTPKQVAVDSKNCKLYICDREGLRVHRSNLDGSEKEVLVQRGDWRDSTQTEDKSLHCVGICLDVQRGKLYWTRKGPSKGGKGRIYRTNISLPTGQTARDRDDIELLFDNLPEPIDLEMDADSQMLYWTDRGDFPNGNTLNRADISTVVAPGNNLAYTILA